MAASGSTPSGEPSHGGGPRKRWGFGPGGRPVWETPDPSPEEVAVLSDRFPELVEVPPSVLDSEAAVWAQTGIVARSLGRRVSTETLARELRSRAGIKGEVRGAYLDNGFSLLRVPAAADRDLLLGRPWLVAGQAVALEAWRPGFFPVAGAISSAAVWVRLPHLPAEYWSIEALRLILRPAGDLLGFEERSTGRSRMGYARVSLRLSLSQELRPGVRIQGVQGPFWQRFVYEGLEGVCFSCGLFHEGACPASSSAGASGALGAQMQEQVPSEGTSEASGQRPSLGPWLLAVRKWRPSAADSSSHRPGKEPVVPRPADEWSTPVKLARRGPSGRQDGSETGGAGSGMHDPN